MIYLSRRSSTPCIKHQHPPTPIIVNVVQRPSTKTRPWVALTVQQHPHDHYRCCCHHGCCRLLAGYSMPKPWPKPFPSLGSGCKIWRDRKAKSPVFSVAAFSPGSGGVTMTWSSAGGWERPLMLQQTIENFKNGLKLFFHTNINAFLTRICW